MPKVHIESNSPSIGYNPPQQVLAAGAGAAPFQAAISASRQEAQNWGQLGALGGKLFEAGLMKVRQDEETAALGAINRLSVAEAEARASLMQEFTLGSADQGRVEYNARMQKARDEILQSSGIKYRLGADVFNRRADDLLSRGEAAWAGYEAGERRKFRLLTLDENTAVIANSVSSGELSVTDGYGQSADGIDRVLADWPEASRLVYKKHAAAQITLAEVNRLARNGDYTAAKGVLSGNKGLFSPEGFRAAWAKLRDGELYEVARAVAAGGEVTPEAVRRYLALAGKGGGDFAGLSLERQVDIAMEAISGQESGGDYTAENGRTKAYGRFQIMPGNWPNWSKEAGLAGAEPTPENQDKVARHKIGQYLKEYNGDLRKAAIAWYAGPGAVDNPKYDYDKKQGAGDEPSINEYADSIVSRAGGYQEGAAAPGKYGRGVYAGGRGGEFESEVLERALKIDAYNKRLLDAQREAHLDKFWSDLQGVKTPDELEAVTKRYLTGDRVTDQRTLALSGSWAATLAGTAQKLDPYAESDLMSKIKNGSSVFRSKADLWDWMNGREFDRGGLPMDNYKGDAVYGPPHVTDATQQKALLAAFDEWAAAGSPLYGLSIERGVAAAGYDKKDPAKFRFIRAAVEAHIAAWREGFKKKEGRPPTPFEVEAEARAAAAKQSFVVGAGWVSPEKIETTKAELGLANIVFAESVGGGQIRIIERSAGGMLTERVVASEEFKRMIGWSKKR